MDLVIFYHGTMELLMVQIVASMQARAYEIIAANYLIVFETIRCGLHPLVA